MTTFLRSFALLAGLAAGASAAAAPAAAASAAAASAAALTPPAQKSDLHVLLVTHDPESPRVPIPSLATERTYELYRERGAAYGSLLREHFESVDVVLGMDYREEMSDGVDVTVFDSPPLRAEEFAGSPATEIRERSLGRGFSRPALMIGYASPRIGEPIGLKLDWL